MMNRLLVSPRRTPAECLDAGDHLQRRRHRFPPDAAAIHRLATQTSKV